MTSQPDQPTPGTRPPAGVKLTVPVDGQRVLRGCLKGVGEDGRVVFESDGKEHRLDPAQIESGRLSFDWQAARGAPRRQNQGQRGKRAGRSAPGDR